MIINYNSWILQSCRTLEGNLQLITVPWHMSAATLMELNWQIHQLIFLYTECVCFCLTSTAGQRQTDSNNQLKIISNLYSK